MKNLRKSISLALLMTLGLQFFPYAAFSEETHDPMAELNPDYRPLKSDLEFSQRSQKAFGAKNEEKVVRATEVPGTTLPPVTSYAASASETSKTPSTTLQNPEIPNTTYEPSKKDLEFSSRSATAEKFTFKTIPRDLGLSMKESFWGWGALGFAGGLGLVVGAHQEDQNLENHVVQNAVFGHTGNEIISWTFSPYTIGGVSILTWIAAHCSHHPKLELTGRALTEALLLSLGIDTVAKIAFRRTRPDGGSLSFPSAHATAAFTAAGVLTTFYGWKAALPSYAMATLVSASRIDSKSHWLSDVVMGAVLGSVIGVGTARFQKKEHKNLFITPQVSSGNAALNITYIH